MDCRGDPSNKERYFCSEECAIKGNFVKKLDELKCCNCGKKLSEAKVEDLYIYRQSFDLYVYDSELVRPNKLPYSDEVLCSKECVLRYFEVKKAEKEKKNEQFGKHFRPVEGND